MVRSLPLFAVLWGSGGCKDWEALSAEAARCDDRCEQAGGACNDGVCVLPCPASGCRCPDDHSCIVTPEGEGDQPLPIDCLAAASCDVRCGDDVGCDRAQITCGGDCRVACTYEFACVELSVTCGSGACEILCTQAGTCGGSSLLCAEAASCSLECTQAGCAGLSFDCGTAESCTAVCSEVQYTCSGADLDCDDSASCDLECNGDETRCAE